MRQIEDCFVLGQDQGYRERKTRVWGLGGRKESEPEGWLVSACSLRGFLVDVLWSSAKSGKFMKCLMQEKFFWKGNGFGIWNEKDNSYHCRSQKREGRNQESLSCVELTEICRASFELLHVTEFLVQASFLSYQRDRGWCTQLLNYNGYYYPRFLNNKIPDFI